MNDSRDGSRDIPTCIGVLAVTFAGAPNAPCVLLWPSLFTSCRLCFGWCIETWTEAGYRTILIDPPGQGRSGAASGLFSMADCGTAAFQIVDALDVLQPVAVFGVSWGGFVAMRMALDRPERISCIALSNSSASAPDDAMLVNDRKSLATVRAVGLPEPVANGVVAALTSAATRRSCPELAAALKAEILQLDAGATATNIESVLLNRTDMLEEISRIELPALIVAGRDDMRLPVDHSLHLYERLTQADLVVLAAVGHLAPAEASSRVASTFVNFLRGAFV